MKIIDIIMTSIISFSGRKSSGKSTLCNLCEKNGYIILNFADSLKKLCCKILHIEYDFLNEIKNNDIYEINLTDIEYQIISNETDIDFNEIKNIFNNNIPKNIRELLQFLGTDLIRKFNKNWHVNKLKEQLKEGQKYVFSDCRFNNELELVKQLGGETFFIIRPYYWENLSNHLSEISITWDKFNKENILINIDLNKFIETWENYLFKNIKPELNYVLTNYNKKNTFKIIKNKFYFTNQNEEILKEIKKEIKTKFNIKQSMVTFLLQCDNPLIIENYKLNSL